MDRDSSSGKKDSGIGSSPSANALILLVTLLTGAVLVRQLPLSDSRPSTEPKAYDYFVPVGVDARLWQDPIGAVSRGMKGEQESMGNAEFADAYSSTTMANQVTRWARTEAKAKPIIVGAMIPGGSYPGYAEWRRKARFGVLAGLKEMGFTPDDPGHLHFFLLDDQLRKALYTDVGGVARVSQSHFFAYEWYDFSGKSTHFPSGGPAPDAGAGGPRLLLIWLDQDFFWENTVDRIGWLFGYLLKENGSSKKAAADSSPDKPNVPVIILGPGDSNMLRRMATLAARKQENGRAPDIDLSFYDYAATAPDIDLLPTHDGSDPLTVHEFFARSNLNVFRTVGDDSKLACALVRELKLRGIGVPASHDTTSPSPEIVLVSEMDTEYGRALSEITKGAFTRTAPCSLDPVDLVNETEQYPQGWPRKNWISSYTYLRGLDGRLPGSQTDLAGASNGTRAGSDTDKATPANEDKRIERSEGQGQLDYLRRLAARLQAMDASAQAQGKIGIRAVGVLGSDVYDKLTVLQALKPSLPGAVFFTTDLDARLTHPAEIEWTRNLIVASSFGLDLQPTLQPGIAPFRDAYQTSLYLSTLIALTNARSHGCRTQNGDGAHCPVPQSTIDKWRAQPRLFEIGLRGPVNLNSGIDQGLKANCAGVDSLRSCSWVHPEPGDLAPKIRSLLWRLSFLTLVIGLIAVLLVRGAGKRVRDWVVAHPSPGSLAYPSRKAQLITTTIVGLVAFIAITVVLPAGMDRLFRFLSQDGNGVPISLLDGVSLWPTELIRLVAIILAIYLLHRGWRSLDDNSDNVSKEMKWEKSRTALNREVNGEYKGWKWWERALHAFSVQLTGQPISARHTHAAPQSKAESSVRPNPETGLRPAAEEFWRQYIYQGRFGARVLRVVIGIVLYFLFASLLVMILGFPQNPIRGSVAKAIDATFVAIAVVTMQFLTFFVIDATLLCRQFVTSISRRKEAADQPPDESFDAVTTTTRWPQSTLDHFAAKLNVDRRYVDQWVTIHVIGLRTKAVSKLIYYPYVIISLVVVARSAVFDNWGMPIALIIILATSVLIVTASAIMLRRAAEYARRKAVWRLTNELIRLNDGNGTANSNVSKQVELMIAQINRYDTGSFASYLDQPLVRACLLPLGSFGGVGLLQYLTIWHF